MERLSSHTSSDDQKLYRTASELADMEKFDPLTCWKDQLIKEGVITQKDYAELDNEIKERVRREYAEAEKAEDPSPNELLANVTKPPPKIEKDIIPPGKYRIGDTVNKALRAGLEDDPQRILFGEDIEDPKGGVFRLTQKLSSEFPKQVFNSPLAESTILGVACGLAAYGKRPVFELQFIDFIYPGFNQLVTNISTLRWRSFGNWKCPAVIYAPYGAYLPGGSLWHSQANESALAHYPGVNVVIPSTPADAAGLLWTAMHAEDPVIFLVPKHLLWAEHEYTEPIRAVPLGKARNVREGSEVTVVAWGNTIEKSLEALDKIGNEISVELIDLRSIVPWDAAAIDESVRKTRRLVVVQEDTENCSVGQMIISHVSGSPELWNELLSPPILVSKPNVVIGYNSIYEYAALPDVERIVTAIRGSLSTKRERVAAGAGVGRVRSAQAPKFVPPGSAPPATTETTKRHVQSITVPVMGEGIRSAKIVSLLKQPGEQIQLDDELCEVETDKAVYPIQSSFAGVMGEWKTKVGDTVEIGQELGTIVTSEPAFAEQFETAAKESAALVPIVRDDRGRIGHKATLEEPGSPIPATSIEPALSPTITRKLNRVIPANLQIDARWDAIQEARQALKKTDGEQAPSPSMIIAWAVARAMEKHAPFRRLILEDDQIVQNDNFDLGIAVALEGDRLATAVITNANQKSWPNFISAYNETVAATRSGRVDAMNAPVVITSLGAFEVKAGAPIVVPPSVGTLFVGTAHRELISNKNKNESAEVITLSLTFDHRVVNGAGAAAFANEVKKQIEGFKIPKQEQSVASR
jgi:2-oxoisovalerate dehydrogenase E1 component